jgi:hypothetical protein
MSQTCSGGSDVGATRRNGAALRVADVLALAASPTFALMALLTSVMGGDTMAMAHASSMSVFHGGAWLRLTRHQLTGAPSVDR